MTIGRQVLVFCLIVVPTLVEGVPPARRVHVENEWLAHPAVRVTVGREEGDLVGRDHRALQAAVDYVGNLGGGTVVVGPGEYRMGDSLHLRSGVTLEGAGPATVLKKAPSARSLLAVDGDFGEEAITVVDPEGFEVGGGVFVATQRVRGFHTVCATVLNKQGAYLTLSRPLNADCMKTDGAYAATVFPVISAYHVRDFAIRNLTVDGNREQNEAIDGCRGAGIFFYQGDGGIIENVRIRDYQGDGISFQQSHDVQVLTCRVENCAGGGIHPGSGSQRCLVRGNEVRGNGRDGFFFCWRVREATVESNLFVENAGVGMSIGHKDSDNLIRGNTIMGNRGGGVYWRNETAPMGAHRNRIEGNKLLHNHRFQLFIDGETDGTVIRGNRIEAEAEGEPAIRIGSRAGAVTLEDNWVTAPLEQLDERTTKEGDE